MHLAPTEPAPSEPPQATSTGAVLAEVSIRPLEKPSEATSSGPRKRLVFLRLGCWACVASGCGTLDSKQAGRAAERLGDAGGGIEIKSGPLPDGGTTLSSRPPPTGDLPERIRRYLRSDSDRSMRLEIDYTRGLEPYAESREHLRSLFEPLLDKPEGIHFELDEELEPKPSGFVWDFSALDDFARQHASDDTDGEVTMQVLAIDGHYRTESGGVVLGLAWGQRYIALFQDDIRSRCGQLLPGGLSGETCRVAERAVWAHEVGHVIGLVDNGIPMQQDHRDAEHGRHEASEGCLMYWAYESPALFDTLLARYEAGDSVDLDFCKASRADVAAAR